MAYLKLSLKLTEKHYFDLCRCTTPRHYILLVDNITSLSYILKCDAKYYHFRRLCAVKVVTHLTMNNPDWVG